MLVFVLLVGNNRRKKTKMTSATFIVRVLELTNPKKKVLHVAQFLKNHHDECNIHHCGFKACNIKK
jgi:hypothetical protein